MTATRTRTPRAAVVSAVLLAGLVTGCGAATGLETPAVTSAPASTTSTSPGSTAPAAGEPSDTSGSTGEEGSAAAALETLPVKGRAPKTGYEREQFGPAWADVAHSGCDTRNRMLATQLRDVAFEAGTDECVVLSGILDDPYTATEIAFARGQDTSSLVQVDHVTALSDAWQKGAQQLDAETRVRFANDPLNLLVVDGPTNMSKGDGDAATWLPPNKAFRCQYVARQVAVKASYGLWVTQAEHDAIARVLGTCPGEPLPTRDTEPQVAPTATAAPSTPVESDEPEPPRAPGRGEDVEYANCDAARAAGAAPLHRGEPGYSTTLDREGDGVACE